MPELSSGLVEDRLSGLDCGQAEIVCVDCEVSLEVTSVLVVKTAEEYPVGDGKDGTDVNSIDDPHCADSLGGSPHSNVPIIVHTVVYCAMQDRMKLSKTRMYGIAKQNSIGKFE